MALSMSQIKTNIESNWLMIVGISPSGRGPQYLPGQSEHAVVIVGCDSSQGTIFVNDPFPYLPGRDPYVVAGGRKIEEGQYEITFQNFLKKLYYKDTIVFMN